MRKILFVFLLFSCLFSVKYTIPPYHSIITFGIFGMLCYLNDKIKQAGLLIPKNDSVILKYFFIFIICCLIPLLANNVIGISFIKEIPILGIFHFFSAYLVIKFYYIAFGKKSCLEHLIIICAFFVSCQIFLSIITYFIPSLQEIILMISKESGIEKELQEGLQGYRLMGINYGLFNAGILNSVVLLALSYVISYGTISKKQKVISILLFIIIGFIGMVVSRTTLISLCLSMLLLLINRNGLKTYTQLILTITLGLILISCIDLSYISRQLYTLSSFGYEIFINYFQTGRFHTESTNSMMEMYIYPQNLSTWIIGDGKFRSITTGGYYMGIDIGFLRIIYYGGIIILSVFILLQYRIIQVTCKVFSQAYRKYCLFYLLIFLILNLKGVTFFTFFMFLLYHIESYKIIHNVKK